nr:MAG: hypothetical protein 2 [Luteoviridae sp.]
MSQLLQASLQPHDYQGTPGEDPTSLPWTHGNYVGPYWSDGKLQSSVEWGTANPVDELDNLARQHDAAYAHWSDRAHREAADKLFADEAQKLKKKYGSSFASDPRVAAHAVRYGNYAHRQVSQLSDDFAHYGPLGVIKFGLNNLWNANKMLQGTYLKKERDDVSKFYAEALERDRYNTRGVSTAGRQSYGSGTPELKTSSSKVIRPVEPVVPKTRANVRVPVASNITASAAPPNPGPEASLLWPSKQAKKFKEWAELYSAALASTQNRVTPVTYRKEKKNLDKAKPKKYRKRNAIRPM